MYVKEISVRRVFNLGQYQTLTYEATVAVNENESAQEAMTEAEELLLKQFHDRGHEQKK
jgi:hypothetical protein